MIADIIEEVRYARCSWYAYPCKYIEHVYAMT